MSQMGRPNCCIYARRAVRRRYPGRGACCRLRPSAGCGVAPPGFRGRGRGRGAVGGARRGALPPPAPAPVPGGGGAPTRPLWVLALQPRPGRLLRAAGDAWPVTRDARSATTKRTGPDTALPRGQLTATNIGKQDKNWKLIFVNEKNWSWRINNN